MKKYIYLIFIFIISLSLSGCSKPTATTINNPAPVTLAPVVEPIKPVEPVETSSMPAFDKTAIMKPLGKSVPVLMYHSITYEKDNAICLPVERFEEHLKYLKDNGYYTITLTDLYDYLIKEVII